MPAFLIPILILVGIFAITAGDELIGSIDLPLPEFRLFPEKKESTQDKPTTSQRSTTIRQAPPPTPPPPASFSLDTAIVAGPTHGTVLNDTSSVTLEFSGTVVPQDTKGRITFETRLIGAEEEWKSTSAAQRIFTLPPGSKEYTFQVRSKIGKVVDLTPAERSFSANLSLSSGKVSLTSLQKGTPATIILTSNLKTGETIDLTGWKIQGKAGSFTIPKGVRLVPDNLSATAKDSITITASERVVLSSARGPLGLGVHFRPNKCMGYLASTISFPISVPSSCSVEKPDEQELFYQYFSPACESYILNGINYSSCTMPDFSNQSQVALDAQCSRYLNTEILPQFTYQACLARHQSDEDFLKQEWHVYTNTNLLTQRFDAIELRDSQGLLVDKKEY